MGFMDSVKRAAAKTKVQGELMMLDREIESCKQKHGVAIYEVMYKRHHDVAADEEKLPLPLEGLEAAFIAVTEDLQTMIDKRKQVDNAIDALEEAKEQRAASTTAGEKAKSAGNMLKDAAGSTKLKAEMAFYGREISVRQGIFGVQVFDDLNLMNHEGRFEENSDGVGAALNNARSAMQEVLDRKKEKEEDLKVLK